MSSYLQNIFGGSNQSSQSTSTSTPSNYTAPGLSAIDNSSLPAALQQLLQAFGGQASGAGNPIGNATPTTQAPLSSQEQSLLGTIGQQVGPNTASSSWINSVLSGAQMPGQPGGNPFLSSAITAAQRPTMQNLTSTLSQALPGQFTAAGQFVNPNNTGSGGSSAFDTAAALASNGAANTMGDIAANVSNNAYNTGIQEQTAAAGLDQNEVNNTISALQASALPRLIQQNGLDQGLSLFQSQTSNLLSFLQSLGAIGAPTLANTTTSQSTGTGSSSKGIIPDLYNPAVSTTKTS